MNQDPEDAVKAEALEERWSEFFSELSVEEDVRSMRKEGRSEEEIQAHVEKMRKPYDGPTYTLEEMRAQAAAWPKREHPLEAMKDWEAEEPWEAKAEAEEPK